MEQNTRMWLTLLGTGIAGVLVCLDFTIVNVGLATIQSELKASISQLQWIMVGFGITFCTFLTTMGRFADLVGRRLLLYVGMAGFVASSVGAGLSGSIEFLILFRVLQGVFGAIIFPCGMAVVAHAFPKEMQGKALGIYGSLLGIGLAAGPIVGGMILSIAPWPWIFFINVPLIILSYAICFFSVSESKLTTKVSIDWWGTLLLTISLGSLVFVVNEGTAFGWDSNLILSLFGISILAMIALVFVEKRAESPVMPFALFANHGFLMGSLCYIMSISFSWPVLFLAPLYLQNVIDLNTAATGWVLFSMTFMTIIIPGFAGHILDKKGPKLIIWTMFIVLSLSYILQAQFTTDGPMVLIIIAFVLFGIGWGIGNGIGTPLALSQLENTEEAGGVTGAAITLLNIVGVVALTIVGIIFRYTEKINVTAKLSASNISLTQDQTHFVRSLLSDPEQAKNTIQHFPPDQTTQVITYFKQAFVTGYQTAAWSLLAITVILFIIMQMVQNRKV